MAVLHDTNVAETVETLCEELGIDHTIALGAGGRLLDGWKDDPAAELPQMPDPDDLATLQYTGGTTGLPKGVDITHRQMSINISQREAALPTHLDRERILCMMPLFHVFAVAACFHLSVYCRGLLVIIPAYKPDVVLDAIERERITILPAGPTVFIGLMGYEGFAERDFSSLRIAYSGSAPLPVETLRQWHAITGCPILEGFGQSEAGPVLTYITEDGRMVPGSVGPPLPLTDVEIVDVDTGTKILEPGELGEIRVRGPQIMSGYRNRPKETGDIGELDGEGYLYIRDRKKDMVITGGYNVYPREIDEVLYTHPAVSEAAAFGVPDPYRGEVIHARVVPRPGAAVTADALMDYCRENLAKYKLPVAIELVEALPKTTVGKIDRKAMREAAAT